MQENGVTKTVTESYLVDALSFTEAEARIVEEMKVFISGEFAVTGITRKKYSETFLNDSGDRYYNTRLSFITIDEKSGSEKRTAVNMRVEASSVVEAAEIVEAEMRKTMIDYEIIGVVETAIMDLFPYNKGES
jgi:hypothetical protein